MNSNKGLVKQILTIIFAVALLSAFVGFVGLILLNFRFESYYYNVDGSGDPFLSQNGLESKFRTCFIVLISLMLLSLVLVILSMILQCIKYKNSKREKIIKILNIISMSVVIVCVIIAFVFLFVLFDYIKKEDLSFYYTNPMTSLIQSCYESLLSQSMAGLLPMFVMGCLGLGYFISKIIKRKDAQNVDVVSEKE